MCYCTLGWCGKSKLFLSILSAERSFTLQLPIPGCHLCQGQSCLHNIWQECPHEAWFLYLLRTWGCTEHTTHWISLVDSLASLHSYGTFFAAHCCTASIHACIYSRFCHHNKVLPSFSAMIIVEQVLELLEYVMLVVCGRPLYAWSAFQVGEESWLKSLKTVLMWV